MLKACYIASGNQLTDILTKALGPSIFQKFLFKLNMSCHHGKFEGSVLGELALPYCATERGERMQWEWWQEGTL